VLAGSASGSLVITSPMASAAGLRPLSTIRNSTSRSVKIPVSLLCSVPSSVTSTQPRPSRCMARMASVTVAWVARITARRIGSTVNGSRNSPASKPCELRSRGPSK
jgi:hypothetical protein